MMNDGSSFIRFNGHLKINDSNGKKVGEVPFTKGYDYVREFTLQEQE